MALGLRLQSHNRPEWFLVHDILGVGLKHTPVIQTTFGVPTRGRSILPGSEPPDVNVSGQNIPSNHRSC